MEATINCKICGNKEVTTIYDGRVRSGSFGNMTKDNYKVYECEKCSSRFLNKFLDPDFYVTDEYRNSYNSSSSVEKFHNLHDTNDNEKVCKIGLVALRNKSIADFGTAAGTFLDVVSSVSNQTYAIEPASFFHKQLKQKHEVYCYGSDFYKSGKKVDIATSFDVLEHIENPVDFLKDIYNSLEINGKLYLMTPNFDDILNDIAKEEFDKFNYRTAHYYYFCKNSMKYILELAGFKNFQITYHHKQDISNMIYWLKENKPTGKNKYSFFDGDFNDMYSNYLVKHGKASHLWIEATK